MEEPRVGDEFFFLQEKKRLEGEKELRRESGVVNSWNSI